MSVRFQLTLAMLPLLGVMSCGGAGNTVHGRVTCQNKPVSGSILFSPSGETNDNPGRAVSGRLDDEGRYRLSLQTQGKHLIVVNPRDIPYPPRHGEKYPCDRATVSREVQPGDNELNIDMALAK